MSDHVDADETRCSVECCDRPVDSGGLCSGHRKRRTRGLVVSVPLSDAYQRLDATSLLAEAAIDLAEADTSDDDEYDRALDNLRKSAVRYAQTHHLIPRTTQIKAKRGKR